MDLRRRSQRFDQWAGDGTVRRQQARDLGTAGLRIRFCGIGDSADFFYKTTNYWFPSTGFPLPGTTTTRSLLGRFKAFAPQLAVKNTATGWRGRRYSIDVVIDRHGAGLISKTVNSETFLHSPAVVRKCLEGFDVNS